ncbi:hypothetical protein FB596_105174 [Sphingobium sp. AEW013]|nr:hypothetical protein FB596_105174 [Sphingobium sp. AEW013]
MSQALCVPAQAGTQFKGWDWVPACAGTHNVVQQEAVVTLPDTASSTKAATACSIAP